MDTFQGYWKAYFRKYAPLNTSCLYLFIAAISTKVWEGNLDNMVFYFPCNIVTNYTAGKNLKDHFLISILHGEKGGIEID